MRLAVFALVLLCLVPAVQGDWRQVGHDPAQTARADQAGPTWPDVAAIVPTEWGDSVRSIGPIRVAGDDAYFLANRDAGECLAGLFHLNVSTLATRLLGCVGDAGLDLAIAGDVVVVWSEVTTRSILQAFSRDDGEFAWERPMGGLDAAVDDPDRGLQCTAWVIDDQAIYSVCDAYKFLASTDVVVVKRSLAGDHLWTRPLTGAAAISPEEGSPLDDPAQYASNAINGATRNARSATQGVAYTAHRAARLGEQVVITYFFNQIGQDGVVADAGTGTIAIASDGLVLWTFPAQELAEDTGPAASATDSSLVTVPAPTGDEDVILLPMEWIHGTEMELFRHDGVLAQYGPFIPDEFPTQVAYEPGTVYGAMETSLVSYFIDAEEMTISKGWQVSLPLGHRWSTQADGLILADDTLYGRSHDLSGRGWLHAFSKHDGAIAWSLLCDSAPIVSDGRLLLANKTAVFVIGPHPNALQAKASVSTSYPAPGTPVSARLSLADASPGARISAVWVDWGDGTVDDWTQGTGRGHVYEVVGAVTARFQVRSEAGQTSTVLHTFYVGADDPEKTWLEEQFNAENQNTTFFFLGLLATAAAGLFGVLRVARRRSRLRTEMRELESEFERTKAHPTECELMLSERRAKAHKLALEAKLDEGHAAILVQRVVDLRHKLRISQLDRRLNFLPYGVVQALQEHLRDGTLSLWERDHLVKVLDEDKVLSPKQKTEVRGIIDTWFNTDAGAKA